MSARGSVASIAVEKNAPIVLFGIVIEVIAAAVREFKASIGIVTYLHDIGVTLRRFVIQIGRASCRERV